MLKENTKRKNYIDNIAIRRKSRATQSQKSSKRHWEKRYLNTEIAPYKKELRNVNLVGRFKYKSYTPNSRTRMKGFHKPWTV